MKKNKWIVLLLAIGIIVFTINFKKSATTYLVESYVQLNDPEKGGTFHYMQGAAHYQYAQTFTIGTTGSNTNFDLSKIKLSLSDSRYGEDFYSTTSGAFTVKLRTTGIDGKPTNTDLASGSIILPGTYKHGWIEIPMSSYMLQPSTKYAIVTSFNSDADLTIRLEYGTGVYNGGQSYYSYNSGSSWGSNGEGYDLLFEIYGIGECVPSCSGKTCGDDGCGGSCGTCQSGQRCISNICKTCKSDADTNCDGTESYDEFRNYYILYMVGNVNFNQFIIGGNAWVN